MDIASLTQPSAGLAQSTSVGPNQVVNRDAFMTLLVTQLKNQSPLEPVQNEDFIAQLAQFSMLEGSESTNDRLTELLHVQQLGEGANMIGRKVTYRDPSSGETLPGIVSSVEVIEGQVKLDIGGERIPLSSVLRVDSASA